MVACACTALLSAALIVGLTTVTQNFEACRHYVTTQTQQMRLTDYLALDLRKAESVAISADSAGRYDKAILTIPDYYDSNKVPRMPTIKDGQVTYGTAANNPRIEYYERGRSIYRKEGTVETLLCSDVQKFRMSYLDQTVTVTVTFRPRFQWSHREYSNIGDGTATNTTTILRNMRRIAAN